MAPTAAAIVILALSACTGAAIGRDGAGAVSSATVPHMAGGAADWPTYHGTMSRAGVSATM
jgi:hypothetical protein